MTKFNSEDINNGFRDVVQKKCPSGTLSRSRGGGSDPAVMSHFFFDFFLICLICLFWPETQNKHIKKVFLPYRGRYGVTQLDRDLS